MPRFFYKINVSKQSDWGMRMYMPCVMRVLMGERNDVNKQRKNPNP